MKKENEIKEEAPKRFKVSFNWEPQRRQVYSALIFAGIVVVIYFATIQSFIPEFQEIFSKEKEDVLWRDFWKTLFMGIFAYAFLSTAICFLVRTFKKTELKSYNKKGLIYWLIFGLIFGLIAGLIMGLRFEFN
jgi:H+/Cl- antiporter ClcA